MADSDFEIGFAEIGFRECRAKRPALLRKNAQPQTNGDLANTVPMNKIAIAR
jgi:hypothetical protein